MPDRFHSRFPYFLITGMDFLDLSTVEFRRPLPKRTRDVQTRLDKFHNESVSMTSEGEHELLSTSPGSSGSLRDLLSHMPDSHLQIWLEHTTDTNYKAPLARERLTTCELEGDVKERNILNRNHNVTTPISQISLLPQMKGAKSQSHSQSPPSQEHLIKVFLIQSLNQIWVNTLYTSYIHSHIYTAKLYA